MRAPLPTVNHLPTLKSSCLMRSEVSVPGGTRGTANCATVKPGSTSAPGVHGPRQLAAYLVDGVINQDVPPGTVVGVAVPPVSNRMYFLFSDAATTEMPNGNGTDPASLMFVSHGTLLEV